MPEVKHAPAEGMPSVDSLARTPRRQITRPAIATTLSTPEGVFVPSQHTGTELQPNYPRTVPTLPPTRYIEQADGHPVFEIDQTEFKATHQLLKQTFNFDAIWKTPFLDGKNGEIETLKERTERYEKALKQDNVNTHGPEHVYWGVAIPNVTIHAALRAAGHPELAGTSDAEAYHQTCLLLGMGLLHDVGYAAGIDKAYEKFPKEKYRDHAIDGAEEIGVALARIASRRCFRQIFRNSKHAITLNTEDILAIQNGVASHNLYHGEGRDRQWLLQQPLLSVINFIGDKTDGMIHHRVDGKTIRWYADHPEARAGRKDFVHQEVPFAVRGKSFQFDLPGKAMRIVYDIELSELAKLGPDFVYTNEAYAEKFCFTYGKTFGDCEVAAQVLLGDRHVATHDRKEAAYLDIVLRFEDGQEIVLPARQFGTKTEFCQ